MRIKVAFLILFTAWFSPAGYAQWEWPSYPPPPPPPYPGLLDESDSSEMPMPRRHLSRPPEPTGRLVRGSSDQRKVQNTIQRETLRKQNATKNRKPADKRQKTSKPPSTGSVTSSIPTGTKTPKKSTSSDLVTTKNLPQPRSPTSARRRNSSEPTSRSGNVEETAQQTQSSMGSKSAKHEKGTPKISSDAIKNQAVIAFRNCIASYFARNQVSTEPGRIC
jgi:hypothetical protein